MTAVAREASGALKENLRRRIGAWARRRQGDDQLPIVISTRRVYIVPTRAGLAFAALLLVMLLAGLNYSNSVALLMTFLLAGFGMIAMHLTHRNLTGVALRTVAGVDAFVGEHGRLLVTLENSADTARLALECAVAGGARAAVDVPAGGTARADVGLSLSRRGRLEVDRITRISYLIGIYKALHILYGDELADEWVNLPNANVIFAGSTPLGLFDLLLSEEPINGLLLVGAYRKDDVDPSHPLAGPLSRSASAM